MDFGSPNPVTPLPPSVALTRGFVGGTPQAKPAQAQGATFEARQGFRIGGLRLMVRYADGSELTEMPRLHRLPNVPSWLLGIANLHGMLVPVFDLAGWAGLAGAAPEPALRRMLLVLAHGADAAGVVIDGLPQRLRWAADQKADAATAPARLAPYVHGAALIDGALWFDIDRAALLEAIEESIARTSSNGN
ncbi:chemotaxis protein CheW [Ramlibacter sp. PS4R-6]|uniref:chemotaxis protein CheW n=1 Tax=Ramlibacter sp. PS4R-6 TaxID=3133438 RepID=UPI00309C1477